MEPADKKRMACRILGDYPEPYQETLDFIDKYPDLQETPAQFQERCGQIALACFWKEKHGEEIDPAPSPAPGEPGLDDPLNGDHAVGRNRVLSSWWMSN